jgi:polyhydroxybutyrate depolymerase
MSFRPGDSIGHNERSGSHIWLVGFVVLLGLLTAAQAGARVSAATAGAAVDTYYVHRPSGLDRSKAVPLVVVCCQGKQTETQTGFSQQADRSGFVVAYVSPAKFYNDAERLRGPGTPFPDMTYISSVIDKVTTSDNIDPARVYMTGASAGGVISYRVACYLSDKVAAIGSVAGVDVVPACRPPRPVSVAEIHGTADPAIPYNGTPGFLSTPETVAKWRSVDGCAATSRLTTTGRITDQLWATCDAESAVELVTVAGGGHGWPRDSSIDTTAKLWQFFSSHKRVTKAFSAQLTSVTVRYRSRRTLLVRVQLDQASSVQTRVIKAGRTVFTRTVAAKAGSPTISLTLPAKLHKGTYKVSVLVSAGGDQRQFTRTLRLKR